MKFHLRSSILLAIIVTAASRPSSVEEEELEDLYEQYAEECLAITGADPDQVDTFHEGILTVDPKIKDQIFCMFKKLGLMDEKGDIMDDKLTSQMTDMIGDEKLAFDLVKKCAKKRGDTPQDTAFQLARCFIKYESL